MQRLANSIILLWGWRRWGLAFLAGAVSALALAPFHAVPVLWLTLPVLVWLLDGVTASDGEGWGTVAVAAAAVGWFFGLGYFVVSLWWLGLIWAGGPMIVAAPILVLAAAAGLALFWAAGTAVARFFWSGGVFRIVVLALALTLAEWARGLVVIPWNAFGYVLAVPPLGLQTASVLGLWGMTWVSFLVFVAPAGLADPEDRKAGVVLSIAAVLMLALHAGYGVYRLSVPIVEAEPMVTVRIVQPAFPASSTRVVGTGEAVERLLALSDNALSQSDARGVLVWPEPSFPFDLAGNAQALGGIAQRLPQGVVLIAGARRTDHASQGQARYKSLYAVNSRGEIRDAHDQVSPSPVLGLLRATGALEFLRFETEPTIPGNQRRTLDVAGLPPVVPVVGVESAFPSLFTSQDEQRGLIVALTDQAWFAGTAGAAQNRVQIRLRAVEQGVPLIHAANKNRSAIYDGLGRTVALAAEGAMTTVLGVLPAPQNATWIARFGDFIPLILLLVNAPACFIRYHSE